MLTVLLDYANSPINRIMKEKVPKGVSTRSFVLNDRPAEELVPTAAKEKADIIDISSHGETWMAPIYLRFCC